MHDLADDLAPVGISYFHGERGRRLLRGLRRVIVSDYGEAPRPLWCAEDDLPLSRGARVFVPVLVPNLGGAEVI